MTTIGTVLDKTEGIGQGFGFLRIALAIAIVCWHTVGICYGKGVEEQVWTTLIGRGAASLLPMFFALSGFLVMGSALRTRSLTTFMTFRVLRILPALSTEVILAAVLVGALATKFPLSHYFRDPNFFLYLFNIAGHIVFELPGVFVSNPLSTVNASLWTIPPEIACYLFLALAMLSGAYARLTVYVGTLAALIGLDIFASQSGIKQPIGDFGQQYHLFLCFVVGNLAFHLRYRIPCSALLCVGSAAVGLWLVCRPGYINFIGLVCLTYCTIYLGTLKMPELPLFSRGDYSYGIYLYGFPIQQLVVLFLPGLRTWYFNLAIALPIIVAFAMLSWHCVEAPALAQKYRFGRLRNRETALLSRLSARVVVSFMLVCYGAILLHWSGLDASTGFSPRAHWQAIAALLPVIALAIAIPNTCRASVAASNMSSPAATAAPK